MKPRSKTYGLLLRILSDGKPRHFRKIFYEFLQLSSSPISIGTICNTLAREPFFKSVGFGVYVLDRENTIQIDSTNALLRNILSKGPLPFSEIVTKMKEVRPFIKTYSLTVHLCRCKEFVYDGKGLWSLDEEK